MTQVTSETAKRPESLDEFGCWLNCWADEREHQSRLAPGEKIAKPWRDGYHQAIHDVLREFGRVHPGWETAWEDWTE